MMKGLTIIFTLLALTTLGQFPEGHLDILSKLNCGLTEAWTTEIDQTESFNGDVDLPAIIVDLYTYKTVDDEGGNIGVGIYMFNKDYEDSINSHNWDEDKISGNKIFKTSSYIIVVDYFKSGGPIYDKMVVKVLQELEEYFNDNSEIL